MKKCSVLLLAAVAILSALSDGVFLHAQSGSSVVINEFRPRGPLGGNDEFIELLNPTASVVTIGGWKIQGSNNAGSTTVRATVPTGTTLGPGCFYLIVNTGTAGYSGTVAGNLTYSTGITDDGGLALVRGDNSIADQVGMSAGSAYGEGTRLGPFGSTNADRAYARTAAGVDSNDNSADFAMAAPSTPQNVASVAGCQEVLPEIWPHDVQGDGTRSPHENERVAVRGIVTAKRFNNGFFIQTPDAVAALEANPDTSEGVFVFTSIAPTMVNIGDDVVVTGAVSEFVPAADPAQPPVTEIVSPSIVVRGTGQALPAAVILTSADLSPSGGPLQLEKFEGMRIGASGSLTVIAPTSGTVIEAAGTGSNNGVFYAVFASTPRPFREPGIDVLDFFPSLRRARLERVRHSELRRQPGAAARRQRWTGWSVPWRDRLHRGDDHARVGRARLRVSHVDDPARCGGIERGVAGCCAATGSGSRRWRISRGQLQHAAVLRHTRRSGHR